MLVHWQGNLTGIQRVEYNLARRFALKPDVKFCLFDKTRKMFTEYDFNLVKAKVEILAQAQSMQALEVTTPSGQARYINYLRKTIGPLLPAPTKRKAKSLFWHSKRLMRPKEVERAPRFFPQDKMLILSGDWSDNIFATAVANVKTTEKIKVFLVVYDMLPAVQPAFFVPGMSEQFSSYMKSIFKICDGILAISESTKKDIELFQDKKKLPKPALKVFRLGEDFVDKTPIKPRTSIEPGGFLLAVGTIEARKNHQALYYMVREALKRGIELPPIVIAGKRGWLVDSLLYLVEKDEAVRKRIIFLHSSTDQEIAWLFQNCLLTLYPSFYEGWGLPIAESLYYGKLCLSSNSSSMPEIAGDLIDYYSPNDPGTMLKVIAKYLDNPELLKKKEKQIKENYRLTSWDDTFKQVEEFILNH